jgi:hypothetical protein
LPDHRQQWGDADAAGEEQVPRRGHHPEIVAGTADTDEIADGQVIVDVRRPPAAVRLA